MKQLLTLLLVCCSIAAQAQMKDEVFFDTSELYQIWNLWHRDLHLVNTYNIQFAQMRRGDFAWSNDNDEVPFYPPSNKNSDKHLVMDDLGYAGAQGNKVFATICLRRVEISGVLILKCPTVLEAKDGRTRISVDKKRITYSYYNKKTLEPMPVSDNLPATGTWMQLRNCKDCGFHSTNEFVDVSFHKIARKYLKFIEKAKRSNQW